MIRTNSMLRTDVTDVFGAGRIDACFRCLGTVDVTVDLLNRRAISLQKNAAPTRRNHPCNWSTCKPVAVAKVEVVTL